MLYSDVLDYVINNTLVLGTVILLVLSGSTFSVLSTPSNYTYLLKYKVAVVMYYVLVYSSTESRYMYSVLEFKLKTITSEFA